MHRKINPLIIGFFILSSLLMLTFQNCSSQGFNAATSIDSSSVGPSGIAPAPAPAPAPATASFFIQPNAPYNKLSDSGILPLMNKTNYINFKEYEPQYPLYSDNALKRRHFYMPKNEKVNTANPDEWVFPKDTILWKEFSMDGKKIETRVWEKMSQSFGPMAWRSSVYIWKADQSEADLLTVDDFYSKPVSERQLYQAGQIENKYKLLKLSSCVSCHSSVQDVVLGFNYLELSKKSATVNIFSLKAQNLLSSPPLFEDEIKGTQKARDAMGYIQTNCATCHNGVIHPRNFKHISGSITYQDETIMKTITNAADGGVITFGSLADSPAYQRQSLKTMPPLSTGLFQADAYGTRVLSDWILEP